MYNFTVAQNKVNSTFQNKTKIKKNTSVKKSSNNLVFLSKNAKNVAKKTKANNIKTQELINKNVIQWAVVKKIDSLQFSERERLLKEKTIQWAPKKINASNL